MDPNDQGVQTENYTVIPRSLVFLTKDDAILLLKGAPNKRLWANKYNGIGGHVEPGESPLQCAIRELREETGITSRNLQLRAVIHITMPTPPGIILFVYLGEALTITPHPSTEGTPEWINKTDYPHLNLVEDLYTLLPRVLEPGPLFHGTYELSSNGLLIKLDGSPEIPEEAHHAQPTKSH